MHYTPVGGFFQDVLRDSTLATGSLRGRPTTFQAVHFGDQRSYLIFQLLKAFEQVGLGLASGCQKPAFAAISNKLQSIQMQPFNVVAASHA